MEFWIRKPLVDKCILRVLRRVGRSLTCEEVMVRLGDQLRNERLLPSFPSTILPAPDELFTYYFLLLLASKGKVEKFAGSDGSIRYRAALYVR